ncbi:ribosomal-protein-serine acetyltransferase [Fictibacillus macauensis ZFHKF-1]|uniref:Ribosomal-protein-serine acetyltransferase n=1 Tax=Fictibacillus macauensis ZFHKF-1 TaxID=1196324 RepID=I8J503_9BACL|nr:GNAT family protein [Fictibacillus macauensis]EIT86886.1 ribosomal-protein-serine acetyltransferase [Fictibacillus macauensis ZFHKF-1]
MEYNEPSYIQSNRLTLRHFSKRDVESFYAYRSTPEVAKFQSWENYQYSDAEQFVEKQVQNKPNQPGTWFQFAVALTDTNQLIGDCALHTLLDEPRIVEIGFTIASEHQGKGYGSEAVRALLTYVFKTLGKHKIIAFTDVRNDHSIALLERVGFRREGHLLQNYMSKGKWIDEYQYSLLHSEWSL